MQAFHLDMKVAQYRPDYLALLFPQLRDAGYSHILFEIENKVRLECLGGAAGREAFSKEEFAAILGDCRSAELEPIPLIQTYAHLEWLLTHAPFHALREQPGIAYTLCPLKPESQDFLERYMDEVGELFSNPHFFHLGGDEATYMGTCPDCAAIAESEGKGGLYARHMARLASRALQRGWRPLLWADMVLAHPDCLPKFPKETLWVDWHYTMTPEGLERAHLWGKRGTFTPDETDAAFRKAYGSHAFDASRKKFRPWFYADYLLDQGFDALIAPAACCAGSHAFLPAFDRVDNIASASLKLHAEPRLSGQIVTSWALRLPPLESQWPLLHLSTILRNQPSLRQQTALDVACQKSFGAPLPHFPEQWRTLGRSFSWAESYHGFQWETGYVGQSEPISFYFARRLREGRLCFFEEILKMETLLEGYDQFSQALTRSLDSSPPGNPTTQAWRLGAEGITLRAREYLAYLRAGDGRIDQDAAIEIFRLTTDFADRQLAFLLDTHQPAGAMLIQTILYGETRLRLPPMGYGKFFSVGADFSE